MGVRCCPGAQSMARVNPQTYNSIKGLTDDHDTVIVIFSGSGKVCCSSSGFWSCVRACVRACVRV